MKKNFKLLVQSLTFRQIVEHMIDGVEKQYVRLNFDSFGHSIGGMCVGCAATNAICSINNGSPFDEKTINGVVQRSFALNVEPGFLDKFEHAIDNLRQGFWRDYNFDAQRIGIARIPEEILPELKISRSMLMGQNNYKEMIPVWREFAERIPSAPQRIGFIDTFE